MKRGTDLAKTLATALLNIMHNPAIFTKGHAELDRGMGTHHLLSMSDNSQLWYIDYIAEETVLAAAATNCDHAQ